MNDKDLLNGLKTDSISALIYKISLTDFYGEYKNWVETLNVRHLLVDELWNRFSLNYFNLSDEYRDNAKVEYTLLERNINE